MTNDAILDAIVGESCLSLFQDYSLPLQPIGLDQLQDKDDLLYCGVLGFTGARMRGTLMLATSEEPLGRTNPARGDSLKEWIAELANQLLGRIKAKLLRRSVTIHISLPVVIRGKHLARVPRAELLPHTFASEGGLVYVWFDAEFSPTLDLNQIDETAQPSIVEGTGVLF